MYMNREQLMRRLKSAAAPPNPAETRQLLLMMEARIHELETRIESMGRPGASEDSDGKDRPAGTAKRGRPRKSDAKSSDKTGSA